MSDQGTFDFNAYFRGLQQTLEGLETTARSLPEGPFRTYFSAMLVAVAEYASLLDVTMQTANA
jgi:hypothetical protein